jgi:hypothetical protein
MGHQRRPAECDFFSVVKDVVDRDILLAPIHSLPPRDVLFHDHDLGSDALPEKDVGLLVIAVGVASQDDLDVVEVEAERFDAPFDERNRSLEIRVDEDVPLGCGDQKRTQAPVPTK